MLFLPVTEHGPYKHYPEAEDVFAGMSGINRRRSQALDYSKAGSKQDDASTYPQGPPHSQKSVVYRLMLGLESTRAVQQSTYKPKQNQHDVIPRIHCHVYPRMGMPPANKSVPPLE
jgi:hypothetical protein